LAQNRGQNKKRQGRACSAPWANVNKEEIMETLGLVLNTVGIIVLAYAQNELDRTTRLWLTALDFSVETILTPGTKPTARVLGMEKQMNRTLTINKWVSRAGWGLTGLGFILQLVRHLIWRFWQT